MRRTNPIAAAVVGAVAVVLVIVALPGLGLGEPTSFHGGSPSDVFMQTNPGLCATVDGQGGMVMGEEITFDDDSHVFLSFTYEWGTLDARLEGLVDLALLDPDGTVIRSQGEWGFAGSRIPRTSGTVTWSFENVPAGTYTAIAGARVDASPAGGLPLAGELSAGIEECALTAFVIPVA